MTTTYVELYVRLWHLAATPLELQRQLAAFVATLPRDPDWPNHAEHDVEIEEHSHDTRCSVEWCGGGHESSRDWYEVET